MAPGCPAQRPESGARRVRIIPGALEIVCSRILTVIESR
jgi:hypothetical protein